MRGHGGGSIITISSTSATKVQPWLTAYVTSKAAVDMLTRCAAVELGPHNIRVNSVQPGYIPTEIMSWLPRRTLTAGCGALLRWDGPARPKISAML